MSAKRSKPEKQVEQYEALKKRLKQKFQNAKLEKQTESENLQKLFKPVVDPILEQTKLQMLEGKQASTQRQQQIKELLAIEEGQKKQEKYHGKRLEHIQRALEAATGHVEEDDELENEDDAEIQFNVEKEEKGLFTVKSACRAHSCCSWLLFDNMRSEKRFFYSPRIID